MVAGQQIQPICRLSQQLRTVPTRVGCLADVGEYCLADRFDQCLRKIESEVGDTLQRIFNSLNLLLYWPSNWTFQYR